MQRAFRAFACAGALVALISSTLPGQAPGSFQEGIEALSGLPGSRREASSGAEARLKGLQGLLVSLSQQATEKKWGDARTLIERNFVGARQLVRQDGGSGGQFYGAQPLQPTQPRAPAGERLHKMVGARQLVRQDGGSGGQFYGAQPLQPTQPCARAGKRLHKMLDAGGLGGGDDPRGRISIELLEPGEQAKARETFQQVATLGRLRQIPATLSQIDPDHPAATDAALRGLETDAFPEGWGELRRPLEALRGLDRVRTVAETFGGDPPDVSRISSDLARLRAGTADAGLAGRVQFDLATKALLDGHPEQARRLLPEGGASPHADACLSDARTLLLGEGRVEGWAAGRALAPGPMSGAGSPRGPPPGILKLLPDGARSSWKVEVSPVAPKDLITREEVHRLQGELKAEVGKHLGTKERVVAEFESRALRGIEELHRSVATEITERNRDIAEVEKNLGDPLNLQERDQVFERRGRKPIKTDTLAEEIRSARLAEAERMRVEAERVRVVEAELRVEFERVRVEAERMRVEAERVRVEAERAGRIGETLGLIEAIERGAIKCVRAIEPVMRAVPRAIP